jgi:hypothetical protein
LREMRRVAAKGTCVVKRVLAADAEEQRVVHEAWHQRDDTAERSAQ